MFYCPRIPLYMLPFRFNRHAYSYYPYVDVTIEPLLKFSELGKELHLKYYNLAYIVATSKTDYKASWGGHKKIDNPTLLEEIRKVKVANGDIIASFGGPDGHPISLVAPTPDLAGEEYVRVIKSLGLRQIDFDIPDYLLTDPASTYQILSSILSMQKQLRSTQRYVSTWFTLPVSPSGLTNHGVQFLLNALVMGIEITGLNINALNYGKANIPTPMKSMGHYAIMACEATAKQVILLNRRYGISIAPMDVYGYLGVTLMPGMNDLSDEITYPQDAILLKQYARRVGLNRLSIWSLNRDRPCSRNNQDLNNATNCSGIDQTNYEFSKIFAS